MKASSNVELTAREIAAGTLHNPDTDLIRTYEAHLTVLAAANNYGAGHDDCPLWRAYERSRGAISAVVP